MESPSRCGTHGADQHQDRDGSLYRGVEAHDEPIHCALVDEDTIPRPLRPNSVL